MGSELIGRGPTSTLLPPDRGDGQTLSRGARPGRRQSYDEATRDLAPGGPAVERRKPPEASPLELSSTTRDETKGALPEQTEELDWHGYGPLTEGEQAEVGTLKEELRSQLIGTFVDRLTGVAEACDALDESPLAQGLLADIVYGALAACAGGLAGLLAGALVKGLGERLGKLVSTSVSSPTKTMVDGALKASSPVTVPTLRIAMNDVLRAQQIEFERTTAQYLGQLSVKTPTRDVLESLRSQADAARLVRSQAAARQRVATIAEWAARQSGRELGSEADRGVLVLWVYAEGRQFVVTKTELDGVSDEAKDELAESGLTLGDVLTPKFGMTVQLRFPDNESLDLTPENREPELGTNASKYGDHPGTAVARIITSFAKATLSAREFGSWSWTNERRKHELAWLRQVVQPFPLSGLRKEDR